MCEDRYGRITKLQIFREKGRPGELRESVKAIPGQGLEGDRHADGGRKQISLLDREVRVWMENCEEKGLCFARFKENIQIDGGMVPGLKEGDILQIGEAKIRITGRSKRCFPECRLFREGAECRLSTGNAWAEVVAEGELILGCQTILK